MRFENLFIYFIKLQIEYEALIYLEKKLRVKLLLILLN